MNLRRLAVKYIRDKAKSLYKREQECQICSSSEELQLHHYNSLSHLWAKWLRSEKLSIKTEQDILDNREAFIIAHDAQLYDEVVTLCKPCHMGNLHKVFGRAPSLATTAAQMSWVAKMRNKHDSITNKSHN